MAKACMSDMFYLRKIFHACAALLEWNLYKMDTP